MSLVKYINRKDTNCNKWDGQTGMFGEEGLHAMWVADMDFQAPDEVLSALADYINTGVFGYFKIPEAYYNSVMQWEEQHHGAKLQKEWLRFSPGVVSAINWILQFMTKPDDGIIVLTPVYYPFLHAANNNNRKLISSELKNENGQYTIDFEDFEKKIVENNVSLFILCSPHNPVGRVWTQDELAKLFEICRKHHVFIISDEIHQDLTFGEHTHTPSLSIGNYSDMIFTLIAPSKTFNLAGCQNSIIVIPNKNLRKMWDEYTTGIRVLNGNPFGYIAAQAAYEHGADWLKELLQIVDGNYQYMKETFARELPPAIVSPLEGTYLAWIDLGHYVPSTDIKDFMQKKCHLALDYGEWFGGEEFATFVRMNLATSRENVEIGVRAIIDNIPR